MNSKIFSMMIGILYVGGGLLIGQSAEAKDLDEVAFADTVTVAETPLTFQGAGIIRHLGFIRVNAVALYVGEKFEAGDVYDDIPKRLEFEYFHKIKATDFVKMTNNWMAENNAPAIIERLQPQIDQFNALYVNVQPDDRYALTYLPGRGTELSLNGEPLGTVEDADFVQALFAIWLRPKPDSKSAKAALLGN